ncbi:hypothetical protein OIU77_030375 [Salix suchowensis]|uniref:Uncharacterized protein n=1 Tax=Salix suchowensis TaxID=1278906 RepID=A0ABQ9BF95_9ROSI|nr:hypothetical protein OIU77_030375 [Salix suchowensis]
MPYKRNRPQEDDSDSAACNISPPILKEGSQGKDIL